MGRLLLLALGLLGGCAQIAGLDDPLPGGQGPGCYGQGLIKVCFAQAPSTQVMLSTTIATGDFSCNQGVDMAMSVGIDANTCVLSGTSITVPSGVTTVASNAAGTTPRPLVLVGTDSITIDGKFDATGDRNGFTQSPPPGDGFTGCMNGANPSSSAAGGGGGQGGSFIGKGGSGGAGDGGAAGGGSAGAALAAPTALHAGCAGHAGGYSGSSGGGGGGAIYFIAGNTMSISGRIDASGGGGSAGGGGVLPLAPDQRTGSGGGGGGSGGMIGLDAKTVTISGAVCAIGGGGSSGWGGFGNAGGVAGGTTSCVMATGGNGQAGGGAGGAGGMTGNGTPGSNGSANAGGGGGGGGGGYIKIYGTASGATATNVVPAPS